MSSMCKLSGGVHTSSTGKQEAYTQAARVSPNLQEVYTQEARVSPNLFLLVVELLVGSSARIVQ